MVNYIRFTLPFGQGQYRVYPDRSVKFFNDDPEDNQELPLFSNWESLEEDLRRFNDTREAQRFLRSLDQLG